MKKLLLSLLAATTIAGAAQAYPTVIVANHAAAEVGVALTYGDGGWDRTAISGYGTTATFKNVSAISAGVHFAGYGMNKYGPFAKDDNGTYKISFWQQQPGYFAVFIDKVN